MLEQHKYINPLTDFGFKKLFGTESNKALLIDFLNTILPQKIKDLTYTSNEKLGRTQVDRKAVFDLHCTGEYGERFVVEMQKAKQDFFKDRSVFYASFPIQDQAVKGEWDYELKPVYLVAVLNFAFEETKTDSQLLHTVQLKRDDGAVFYEKLKFIYLELPKFTKSLNQLRTNFDKWLYLFKHLGVLETRPEELRSRVFAKLFEAAEIARYTPEEQKAYLSSLKYYWDLNNVINTAKREGLVKGIEEGIEKGKTEGLKEGIERGRAEGIEKGKIESVLGLYNNGVSIDIISKSLNIPKKRVQTIIKLRNKR